MDEVHRRRPPPPKADTNRSSPNDGKNRGAHFPFKVLSFKFVPKKRSNFGRSAPPPRTNPTTTTTLVLTLNIKV